MSCGWLAGGLGRSAGQDRNNPRPKAGRLPQQDALPHSADLSGPKRPRSPVDGDTVSLKITRISHGQAAKTISILFAVALVALPISAQAADAWKMKLTVYDDGISCRPVAMRISYRDERG